MKPLELMFAGLRKDDPIYVPEIIVSVMVSYHCASIGLYLAVTPKKAAEGADIFFKSTSVRGIYLKA